MKIHYFEDGIKDSSFDSVKTTILVDRQKFQDFDSVMLLYVNFKRTQKNDIPSQGCNVPAITQGRGSGSGSGRQGRGGSSRGRGSGCGGGGRGGPNSRVQGLVPKEEIDKVTNIENKRYPLEIYNNFTPAQKATHWQLCNPEKTPRSGPAKSTKTSSSAAAFVLVSEFNIAMSAALQ